MSGLDAHVHVWDPARLRYPWLHGHSLFDRAFLPEEYAASGVDRVVFVQAAAHRDDALAEVRWVDSLDWPSLVGIVADGDLRSPDLEAHLDRLAEIDRVVGVRHLLQGEDATQFADPALLRGLTSLGHRKLRFDACIRHSQLPALVDFLKAVPSVGVVLDHLGKPPVDEGISSEAGQHWRFHLGRLATLPNVHVKLSGLPAETADEGAYVAHADDFLRCAVDVFGPARAMVGSDWPVSARLGVAELPAAWLDRVQFATRLDGAEWDALAWSTGIEFYGLADED